MKASTLLALVSLLGCASASVEPFRPGERVLFCGDSITHGGKYVFYLQLFENLRHPGSGVRLVNGGRSGGTAREGLAVFDREIAASRPDRAFLMFGMNDIGRSNWKDESPKGPEKAAREKSLETFSARMAELMDRFSAAGVRLVPMTPTPFDQYNPKAGENIAHCNDGLAAAAGIVRRLADGRNLGTVDFHAPMTKLFSDSAEDFVFCRDRVHPGNEGHLYMAALVLSEMGVSPSVGDGLDVTARSADGSASFDYAPRALPFPLMPEYETVEAFFPLTDRFNREIVRVAGLKPGRYTLAFDGHAVGDYSPGELARGVNVALLDTPNQRRAQALVPVMRRLQSVVAQYRNVMLVSRMVEDAKVDPADFAAADVWLDKWLDGQRTSVWYGGVKAWVDGYRAGRGRIAETEAEIESLYARLAAVRPASSRVTVTRIATLSPVAAEWERKGRPETLEWFSAHQFGRTPIGRTPDETFGPTYVSFPELGLRIDVSCHLPEGASAEHPAPVFVFGDHVDLKSPDFKRGVYKGLPIGEITARGYAFVRWNFNDVCPNASGYNKPGLWPLGVIAKLATGDERSTNVVRQADSWGTIGAWAWGNSRVLDWIESRPELDARKVAVVGHSRGGKTALWTAAQDARFAMAVSNGSGCGGAGLARERVKHEGSERFKDILGMFPNWFCPAFAEWIGREAEVPHDSDDLIRLVAPRLVYVASGDRDTWACPASEKAALDAARDIYRAYAAEDRMGYHCHEGPHKLHAEDWAKFMDFADRHFKRGER